MSDERRHIYNTNSQDNKYNERTTSENWIGERWCCRQLTTTIIWYMPVHFDGIWDNRKRVWFFLICNDSPINIIRYGRRLIDYYYNYFSTLFWQIHFMVIIFDINLLPSDCKMNEEMQSCENCVDWRNQFIRFRVLIEVNTIFADRKFSIIWLETTSDLNQPVRQIETTDCCAPIKMYKIADTIWSRSKCSLLMFNN